MNRTIFIILLTAITFTGRAQSAESSIYLSKLNESDWETDQGWFGKDTVKLKPIERAPSLDTCWLSDAAIDSILRTNYLFYRRFGERLHFEPNGQFIYTFSIPCPIGETLYHIKSFTISGEIAKIEYKEYMTFTKDTPYTTTTYKFIECNKNGIVLLKLE